MVASNMAPVGGGPRLELPLEVLTLRTFGPLPTLVRHLDLRRPPITDEIDSRNTVELSMRINETMITNPKHLCTVRSGSVPIPAWINRRV